MHNRRHRSPTPSAKPYGYGHGHTHDSVAGLQVIQYRSYQRNISIYHLRTHLLPLRVVRRALQSQKEYRDRLTSYDPLRYFTPVEGDEIPPGCIEAAYMPNILHGHGSALALRAGAELESEAVEWYIFNEPIHETSLSQIVCINGKWDLQSNPNPDEPQKVFDLVGYAEKGLKTRTVRGANREHKGWHDALCASELVKKRAKLTWKGYGNQFKADQKRHLEEKQIGTEKQERDEAGDVEMRDELMMPPQPPQNQSPGAKRWGEVERHVSENTGKF